MNNVVFMGRLVRSPDLRTTSQGTSVCNFTIAVKRRFKNDTEADFIDCVAWRAQADFISSYFAKGDRILLNGELQTIKYEDKQGNKRTAFEVIVNNVDFVEKNMTTLDGDGDMGLPFDL